MVKYVIACVSTLMVACIHTFVVRPELIDPGAYHSEKIPDSWTKYGACYLYDELFIEASSSSGKYYRSWCNRIIYNKKLRILSNDGVAYGNVEIPYYDNNPRWFMVTLVNADGDTIPLKMDELKREFRKKSVIVVPNVTAGCVISIYVEYETNNPIFFHEHTFRQSIPVVTSKVTFSYSDNMHYDFKGYNLGVQPEVVEKQNTGSRNWYHVHTYELRNVMPPSKLGYLAYTEDSEKWVSIVLRRAIGNSVFTNWPELASNYEKVYFNGSGGSFGRNPILLIDDIKKVKTADYEVADSLLQWTQEYIVQDETPLKAIDLAGVYEKKKGNMWELTALLKRLFIMAGLKADIVITRSRGAGGFDKEFITPAVLNVPLVVVTVDTLDYVAFPFRRGAKLGEYPAVFHGLYGLSLNHGEPGMLPPSCSGSPGTVTTITIDCTTNKPKQQAVISFNGDAAFDMRTFLRTLESRKQREFVQKILTELGTSNALDECAIRGIETPGVPLIIEAKFSNPNQILQRNEMMEIKLSNVFQKYYQSYDTLREETFVTVGTVDDTETVYLVGNGNEVSCSFECKECDNELFTVKCETAIRGDTTILRRVLHGNAVSLDKDTMRGIYTDILVNNRITESSVAIAPKGTRKKRRSGKR